ncbi:hypothetical protein DICPUDRAFT_44127 [Dictyostelium purpureum]|uniref:CCAAT-binding factor domain-containing protein n=1 Tax=Dictyostelium purpureum TaxID=5786 RepID=F1A5I6_DICPU|nr:uncharacterized protein DICPUDRAFT_44127 [Dictyostelium purpureum]EGC28542.1 hypothetical protein DICPUDRAFT_44127 [Dictyostelium purpureum]|eukprot:XP_003294928.1 hypothetical protein DICPUDRAFT_44127 [Dictyostelium purpureum]
MVEAKVSKTKTSVTPTKKKNIVSKFNKNRAFDNESTKKVEKKVAPQLTPIEIIKDIEEKVIESTENSNKILEIIKICKSNIEELEIVFQSIKSLEKIFLHLFDSNNLIICKEFKLLKLNQQQQKKSTATQSKDPLVIFTHWLFKIYNNFIDFLKELLNHEDPSIQLPALTTYFNIIKRESVLLSNIPEELIAKEDQDNGDEDNKKAHYENISRLSFRSLILHLMLSNNFNTKLVDHLTENFCGKYQDLFYYSLWSINEIAQSHVNDCKKEAEFEKSNNVTVGKFVENIFDFLCYFEPFIEAPEEWSFFIGSPNFNAVQECSATLKKKQLKLKKSGELVKPKSMNDKDFEKNNEYWNKLTKVSSYRNIFSKTWISFLTLPLPPTIYKHVLLGLPDRVFPFLTDPKVLLDFFTNSYDLGGVTSILSLNGLFILITQYNLDYPEFFNKLYSLFQPGVLYAKYRARFFKLADLFLTSKLLPIYLIAAFIKRCATLCLISPPHASLILLPMIYNLLQRNPNCHCLINNPIKQLSSQFNIQKQQSQTRSVLLIKEEQPTLPIESIKGVYGNDPYDPLESDPSKCNAIKSSLWEIQILRDHYSPEVSKMARLFDGGLKNVVDMNEFSNVTYHILYENSYKKKYSSVPLAYQQKSKLINDNDLMEDWEF